MRLLDATTSTRLTSVGLYLGPAEAQELKDALDQLLSNRELHHLHISADDYQEEITVSLYDDKNLSGYDERSRRLNLEDR